MGLDIYCYTVVPEKTEKSITYQLSIFEKNKHEIALFEHFKDFVTLKEEEIFNDKKFSDFIGNDVECINFTSEDGYYIITLDNDREIFITEETYQSFFDSCQLKTLYVIPYYLQRKGMSVKFYSEFLSGCWYIADSDNNEEDSPNVIFTNEMLKKAKTYADRNSPIKSLQLESNQFIYFSY